MKIVTRAKRNQALESLAFLYYVVKKSGMDDRVKLDCVDALHDICGVIGYNFNLKESNALVELERKYEKEGVYAYLDSFIDEE